MKTMKISSRSAISEDYIKKVLIYCYSEYGHEKVLKFYMNNICYFEKSAFLFYAPPHAISAVL